VSAGRCISHLRKMNRAIEAGQAFEFVGGYPEKDLRDHHFLEPRYGWCIIGLPDMMLSPTASLTQICMRWSKEYHKKHGRPLR
jgi:hypothetical protein